MRLRHAAALCLVALSVTLPVTGCQGNFSLDSSLGEGSECVGCAEADGGDGPRDAAAADDGGREGARPDAAGPQGVDGGDPDAGRSEGGQDAGQDAGVDVGAVASCGDGKIDPGETCDGNCPTTCDDGNACTGDEMTGDPSTCDAVCESIALLTCADGDGCCPDGCDQSTDDDCSAGCGDGIVDPSETCDPPGSCPTSCDDMDACTTDTRTGSAMNCNTTCTHSAIVACLDGDGCCAPGCDETNDDDCAAMCGNGVRESGETCDGDCPTSCNDGDACTSDTRSGSSSSCNVTCSNAAINQCIDGDGCCAPGCDSTDDDDCAAVCGNGVRESGETCDGDCPSSCNDNDSCTVDSRSGSSSSCNVTCSNAAITQCTNADGCCAAGCTSATDDDCPSGGPNCTNDASWPSGWKSFEAEVITRLNQARAAGADCGTRGTFAPAGALTLNTALRQASRCHSKDMADNGFFSHTGSDGSRFFDRTAAAGYGGFSLGENIAAGYNTPAEVVTGWMNSEGHCANIMKSGANRVGVGFVSQSGTQWTEYWTMVTGQGD